MRTLSSRSAAGRPDSLVPAVSRAERLAIDQYLRDLAAPPLPAPVFWRVLARAGFPVPAPQPVLWASGPMRWGDPVPADVSLLHGVFCLGVLLALLLGLAADSSSPQPQPVTPAQPHLTAGRCPW
jgi:hypothetical protein